VRKEVWFGLTIMAAVVLFTIWALPSPDKLTQGHLGLLMLSLVVVAIMLGFPTAFTLMGMGMIFAFASYYMGGAHDTGLAAKHTLDLMVQRAYSVMSNDVLISIPLFVFMGYLVERANLIEKLFKSLHLALARIPGSLAVATLVTCAVFATATGIVGAVVTLMGLLALPAMLRAGYNVKVAAGVITAGGCLGILIPPSVMLILYGATAGVSVVKLYAGAFFPGLMLAGLYIIYVMILAKIKPEWAPPLPESERNVMLPAHTRAVNDATGPRVLTGLIRALRGQVNVPVDRKALRKELVITLLPLIIFTLLLGLTWNALTKPNVVVDMQGMEQMGVGGESSGLQSPGGGLLEPPSAGGLSEPPATGLSEPPASSGLSEPPALGGLSEPPAAAAAQPPAAAKPAPEAKAPAKAAPPVDWVRTPTPMGFWITVAIAVALLLAFYVTLTFPRLEIFKMLLASFFPLAILILAVLGTIVFGLATPTEAAAVGAFGGFVLAAIYAFNASPPERKRQIAKVWVPLWILGLSSVVWFLLLQFEVLEAGPPMWVGWTSIIAVGLWCVIATFQVNLTPTVRESVYLTAKTSAMVCWLFVGASIFSAAFALLGGQEIVERWVLSMGLTPVQFMIMAQIIIFLLGWPLEWTEIIVIFMPIFIPLLIKFNIDPLFFGLLVALNLQTAFLSPPVAMAAFYLKGVSPPHVTLNQIFAGMVPFMMIQVLAIAILYAFPQIGLWLPQVLYK
jgi:TRAP-type mannitol/chloroaromatic compound transport system permease large subunit